MFLFKLNDEEKLVFLELAHYVARSDGNFSEKEEFIINQYCAEMQIGNIKFDKESFDIDKSLSEINSNESQKIFLLEIMVLMHCDNYLHCEEKKVLDVMVERFNISPSLNIIYEEWAKSIVALYVQGQALITL